MIGINLIDIFVLLAVAKAYVEYSITGVSQFFLEFSFFIY